MSTLRTLTYLSLGFAAACASAPQPTAADTMTDSLNPARHARRYPALPDVGSPPKTVQKPESETLHGTQHTDDFRWLEDEKAPEVQAWMGAQDAYTRGMLNKLPGRDALTKRLNELLYIDSVSAPIQRKNRFFYTRTHADKEKGILYWRNGEKGAEKVLLDPNTWSPEGNVSLGGYFPSWDGKKVVFAQKPNAADEAILHVIDVDSGVWSKVDVIEGAKYASPSWTPDGKGFYYEYSPTDSSIPTSERPGYTEVRFHTLGKDPKTDTLVRERTGDPKTFLQSSLSRDGKALFVYVVRGWSETDVYMKRLDTKQKDFTLLVQGKDAQYGFTLWKDQLYIQTDEGARKQRIFKTPLNQPTRENWKELVAEDKEGALESFSIVGGHLALTYLKNAASEVRVLTLDGKPVRNVELPTVGTSSGLVGLEDSDDAYFVFQSFTVPRQVYKTKVQSGATELWSKANVPMKSEDFVVEQVRYPSKDGTSISMFLVRHKDVKKGAKTPTLLYGYGGFNVSLTPTFRGSIFPWLEAGNIYAVANLRGGGEYGKGWHDSGKLANKQNVFDDFAAAQTYLVQQGWTVPSKLGIWGGSNGGLLVGTSMVQHPENVGAVICSVPLLDMLRYHHFGSGRTWIPEYGTAEKAEDYGWISKYSPYQHIHKGANLPALLMMSADHDDRVDPMHARKFVAAVQRAEGTDGAPAFLRIEKNAGHGGADQVKQAIESNTDMFAFLFATIGQGAPTNGGKSAADLAPSVGGSK